MNETMAHTTLLQTSILIMSILVITQLSFGYYSKGSKAARDMAVGTFFYLLLCVYFLWEPSLPYFLKPVSAVLIAFKIFFIYRALRLDFLLTPNDRIDSLFLVISIAIGSVATLTLGFRAQQILYSAFMLFYFTRAGILVFGQRQIVPKSFFIHIMTFIFAYPGLFIFRTARFFIVPPTCEYYSTEAFSVYTTAILLILYTTTNLGIHVSAAYRAEKKIQELLDEAIDEKVFARGLVKIIGHDLRGYISTIAGAANTVDKSELPAKRIISRNADKAESLLTDLVYWGRSRSGYSSNLEDITSVDMLVRAATGDISANAEDREIGIEISVKPGVIRADMTAARVVLRNILTNALKFSPSGSVIRISTEAEEQGFSISITDEGEGMDEKILNEIRSGRYVQSDTGTGSGMKIATSISAASGWKMDFDSRSGEGTTVRIHFPKGGLD